MVGAGLSGGSAAAGALEEDEYEGEGEGESSRADGPNSEHNDRRASVDQSLDFLNEGQRTTL